MVYKMLLCFATVAAFTAGANAADVSYAGPEGWKHNDLSTSSDTTRKVDQWHIAGDVATVTAIVDPSSAYADALSAIEQNFKTNHIKPATDADTPCQGKSAHVIEFSAGPDGHRIIINRLLVPSGPGLVTITYARSDGSTFDPDVKKSEAAYCAASPS